MTVSNVLTRRLLPWMLLLALAPVAARAADLSSALADYNVTAWSDRDGLPRGTIWALAQDRNGYLWIGSESGLVRFDGARFMTWDALGNAPLPGHAVRALCAAKDGSLWVGFSGQFGIVRIEGKQIRGYGAADGLPAGEVLSLAEDASGTIWAAHPAGLFRFANGRWEAEHTVQGRARKVFAAQSGRLFVVLDQSVIVRQPGANHFETIPTVAPYVSGMHEDARGRVWMSDSFFSVMATPSGGVNELSVHAAGSGAPLVGVGSILLSDRTGGLWVGTSGQGLWYARTTDVAHDVLNVETVTTLTGLSNDVVNAILEDHEGNIWAGTADGLNRLRRHPFTTLTDLGVVSGIDASPDGGVWAMVTGGLARIAPGEERSHLVVPRIEARAMHVDHQGLVWLGTDKGVVRYSQNQGVVAMTKISDEFRRVRSITSDKAGTTWFYDLDRGLGRWDGQRMEVIPLPADTRHALICAIHADSHGRLWIGFRQERVLEIAPDHSQTFFGPGNGLDSGTCNAINEDTQGGVWVLGVHGLARFSDGHFTTLRRPSDFPLELLHGLTEDQSGGVWLNSQSSISHLQPADVNNAFEGHWDLVRPTVYNAVSGIAGKSARVGRSAVRTQDGRLWFLTSRGLTVVEPTAVTESPMSGPIHVDSVVVDDQRMIGLPAMLPPRVRRVEFEYSLPTLSPGPRPRFRYRLDGFDTEWHDAAPNQRRLAYTNLPPRNYRMQVENLNADSTTRSSDAWAFAVEPAFYQTTWFAALSVVSFAAVASLMWRRRLHQVRGEFALLLKERVRISREIHDTLLQSLIGVSLQLEQVEHDTDTSRAGKERLIRARKQVEEYIREARESIWNLRSSALEREGLGAALRHAGERAIAETHEGDGSAMLSFSVTGSPDRCAHDVEEQLLRIGQEAVTNATRHGRAQHIRMALSYADDAVILTVDDDGCGFDPLHSPTVNGTHWGLINMKERAVTVGGSFDISSTPGGGTRIVATVPRHPEAQPS